MRLLSAGWSTAGYVTIMGWENVLDLVEEFAQSWGRERARDPGLYYLRVFGDPALDRTWAWRFGGHHISLNYLIVQGQVRAVTRASSEPTPPALRNSEERPSGRCHGSRTWASNWSAPWTATSDDAHCCWTEPRPTKSAGT